MVLGSWLLCSAYLCSVLFYIEITFLFYFVVYPVLLFYFVVYPFLLF